MFEQVPLAAHVGLFLAAALVVWRAGTRIASLADALACRTGIGHAATGLLLLAGITSLPEIAVSVTASFGGNAQLAVNNLLGSVALQVTLLAVADAMIGRDALTSVVPDPVVLLQVALNILVLGLVAAAVISGDHAIAGVGMWATLLLFVYAGSIWLIARASRPGRRAWIARGESQAVGAATDDGEGDVDRGEERHTEDDREDAAAQRPLHALVVRLIGGGALILLAGWLLATSGEAIAAQTGLGQSLGGFVLVAVSTSLPEASTVIASVRLRRYVMAMSDIFGTNLLNAGLLFVVDAVYRGGAVLGEVGNFAAFAALLGVVVSALFLVGLIERRDRTVLRMGYDSLAALVVYGGGVAMLFRLQGDS